MKSVFSFRWSIFRAVLAVFCFFFIVSYFQFTVLGSGGLQVGQTAILSKELSFDREAFLEEKTIRKDLSELDSSLSLPEICFVPGIVCQEEITLTLTKRVTPLKIEEFITEGKEAELLNSIDFSPLNTVDYVGKGMDRQQAYPLQLILKSRGLFDADPTGLWLHESEKSRARFEFIKGYNMTDSQFADEVRELGERIRNDEDYIKNKPLPQETFPNQQGEAGFERFQKHQELSQLGKKRVNPKDIRVPQRPYSIGGSLEFFQKGE